MPGQVVGVGERGKQPGVRLHRANIPPSEGVSRTCTGGANNRRADSEGIRLTRPKGARIAEKKERLPQGLTHESRRALGL